MELKYLQEKDIETEKYIAFYEKYHGLGSYNQRKDRIHWYFKSEGFKLLMAIIDGDYAGQSCAYKVTAVVNGKECEWWWSVDTFALSEMRGKGIGKALQKKLHEDCPNFSSASYSAINGIIKKKCGGHEVASYYQNYYPVSCYLSLYLELALKKLISRKISTPRIRIPFLYSAAKLKGYDVRVLTETGFNPQLAVFFENNLRYYDFFVEHSEAYLKWKYIENPSLRYVALEILKGGNREGVVVFSDVYDGKFAVSKARICKVLDAVIDGHSQLTQRDLLNVIANYWKNKKVAIDGMESLIQVSYLPKIKYPLSRPISMLSTMTTEKINNLYFTYLDQDMEQMYVQNE